MALTSSALAACLGIETYTLSYWVKCGLLGESQNITKGRGSQFVFDEDDLRVACFIRRLTSTGLKPKKIKKVLAHIRWIIVDSTALIEPILLPFGNTELILQHSYSGNTTIMDASRPGQSVMTIVLETLEEEARQILAKLK